MDEIQNNCLTAPATIRDVIRKSRVERARFGAYLRWRVARVARRRAGEQQDRAAARAA